MAEPSKIENDSDMVHTFFIRNLSPETQWNRLNLNKFEESSFENYGDHGSDFSELEEFATGKVTKESKAQKHVREADWDDVIDPSDPPDDYASGGIARMLGE